MATAIDAETGRIEYLRLGFCDRRIDERGERHHTFRRLQGTMAVFKSLAAAAGAPCIPARLHYAASLEIVLLWTL